MLVEHNDVQMRNKYLMYHVIIIVVKAFENKSYKIIMTSFQFYFKKILLFMCVCLCVHMCAYAGIRDEG